MTEEVKQLRYTQEPKVFQYFRNGLRFTWHGGALIEVAFEDNATPYDVINVWNYETDEPTIERSMRGLVNHIDDLMDEEE